MELSEINFAEGRPVDGYGPNFFRISGEVFEGKIVVLPGFCGSWLGFDDASPFLEAASELDVVFVGTGSQIHQIPATFRSKLEEGGIGVEIMNSPTACRTYNIMLSEGRRIGLALIPV
ncbi:MAG: Mth938-like domain-containing protein [Planktomarina sp.]|nr:Mth938-like domain-containing protein [Planktomarina sp.]